MTAFNPAHSAPTAGGPHDTHDADHGHHGDHPPHLAHHFDTPEQQFDAAKVGMWVFLATEILMFGGLFCAYAVYRYNNPDVFRYSEQHLKWTLGATNTLVLLASSLTMALAVRAAQLGQQTYLKLMLAMTLLGGVGFMVIKTVEYADKFSHGLFPGRFNVYDRIQDEERFLAYMGHAGEDAAHATGDLSPGDQLAPGHGDPDVVSPRDASLYDADSAANPSSDAVDGVEGTQDGEPQLDDALLRLNERLAAFGPQYVDPHAGSSDAALHRPAIGIDGTASPVATGLRGHHGVEYTDLAAIDRQNVKAFFGIYYMMTGLHGVHVLVGMGLIGWILVKAMGGAFGPAYFTPVDLVGLYWHIVDLIWIFLFPLLYLIH